MKTTVSRLSLLRVVPAIAALPLSLLAADVTGAWESEFDPQVGAQPAVPVTPASPEPRIARRGGQPIALGPDDKAAFPKAPEGFDMARDGIAHGKIETVEYDSTTVGNKRKTLVYLPPGYSTNSKYPVLYLLHGIGGDEEEWHQHGHPEIILDNLIADKKTVPMIVVLPNGRAQPNDRAEGNVYATAPPLRTLSRICLRTSFRSSKRNTPRGQIGRTARSPGFPWVAARR